MVAKVIVVKSGLRMYRNWKFQVKEGSIRRQFDEFDGQLMGVDGEIKF